MPRWVHQHREGELRGNVKRLYPATFEEHPDTTFEEHAAWQELTGSIRHHQVTLTDDRRAELDPVIRGWMTRRAQDDA